MANESIMRYQIADYLGVLGAEKAAEPTFELLGAGVNTLDENPAAQSDTKAYVNDRAASSIIKSYQPQFPFDTDLIKSEKAVMELYTIGRNELTGADAERDYIRVELFEPVASKENTFKARKFRVAVAVDSCAGAGGEAVKVTGNLNNVGTFVDGEFNTQTKTFTEAGAELTAKTFAKTEAVTTKA